MKALTQLDLISRILCLCDCVTNTSNCGQVGDRPMIVDFGILKQSGGYVKSAILEKIIEGYDALKQSLLMAQATRIIGREEKMRIVQESLREWDLLANIDKCLSNINQFIQQIALKVELSDDLQRYVQDIKTNIGVLESCHVDPVLSESENDQR